MGNYKNKLCFHILLKGNTTLFKLSMSASLLSLVMPSEIQHGEPKASFIAQKTKAIKLNLT